MLRSADRVFTQALGTTPIKSKARLANDPKLPFKVRQDHAGIPAKS